jgi:hypothetical protein
MGNHPGKMDFSKMSLALLKLVPKIFDFSKMILHNLSKTDHCGGGGGSRVCG